MKPQNTKAACLAVALLVTWLPAAALAKNLTRARTVTKDPAPARVVSVPFAKKPGYIVKQVWVGGPPSLGGYAKTVIEKAPEARQKPARTTPEAKQKPGAQTPGTLQRSWVGGPPWLGGYEIWK